MRAVCPARGSIADAPCLHHGVVCHPRNDWRRHFHRSGKDNIEGQPGVATHRCLEENIEAAGSVFPQVQIGRTDFVSEGQGRREQAGEADQNENRSKSPEA